MNLDQQTIDLTPDEYNALVKMVMRRKRREATRAETVARNVVQPFTNSGQTGIAPTAIAGTPLGGDLSGTLPNPTVAKIDGVAITNSPATLNDILVVTNLSPLEATWQTPSIREYNALVGNGVLTTFTLTHNLNTQDCHVTIIRNSSPFDPVFPDVSLVNINQVVISFTIAPATNQYRIHITG